MHEKKVIRELYISQLKNKGVPKELFLRLPKDFKHLLRKKGPKYVLTDAARKKIKVVLTGGIFDVIHMGHIFTLRKAREKGDVLVAVVGKDSLIIEKKKRKPIHSQDYRVMMVEFMKPVDVALMGSRNMTTTLKKVKPNVIVYGPDQESLLKPKGVKVIKLKKLLDPKKFKTTYIIKKLGL